jgi:Caspase domain
MKRSLSTLAAVASLAITTSAPARGASPGIRRVAILVGANDAPAGRPTLRFARDDADELAGVLEQVGGFAASDVHVLHDPHPADLLATFDGVAQSTGGPAGDVLFVFYYSGHSDGHALFPHGEPILLADVRERIERLGARIRVGILDTCRGGSWTQSKGLSMGPPLSTADLLNVDTEGTALVSSSSGIEDADEADTVHGSFFTHYFAAGLRGAADREGDGNVTLQEAFDYARERTVRDSARATRTPQHPSFDLALRGRQDIVLASLPSTTSALQVTAARAPLEIIHLPSGVTVADVPTSQHGLRIALPPGRYLVRTVVDDHVYAKEVEVRPGETATLADGQLEATGNESLAMKGTEPAPRPPRGAIVHVEGDERVVLERSEGNGAWTKACSAPCDQELPLSSMYRVGGSGVRLSAPFQLAAQPGQRIVVHVNAASKLRYVSGYVLGAAGINTMLVGALIILNHTVGAAADGAEVSGPSKTAGQITVGAGAAALLGGILLVTGNASSNLEQSPRIPSPREDAWLRSPTWHEAPAAASPSTRALSVPLVHLTF